MKVKIYPRGTFVGDFGMEKTIEVPEYKNVAEVLFQIGLDWEACAKFGFVAVNGKRVDIYEPLNEGDVIKIYPKVSGG